MQVIWGRRDYVKKAIEKDIKEQEAIREQQRREYLQLDKIEEAKESIKKLEEELDWVQVDIDYAQHAYKFAKTDEERQVVVDKGIQDNLKKDKIEAEIKRLKQEIRQIEYQNKVRDYQNSLDYAS